MCADISQIGNLQPVQPLDMDTYPEQKSGFQLPKAGRYTVRAPESFPQTAFGATKAGALSAQIDPTIVGPTNEGFTVRFTKISAKTYERNGIPVSQFGDYLRATGVTGTIPGDAQGLAEAVERTAGAVYDVELDWEARHTPTGFQVKGMRNFPSDGNGGHQSWVTHPTEKDDQGNPLRLRANVVVRRYIPQGK